MTPREILKTIRQIEIRTNRIVTESLAGASNFKPLESERFGNYGEFAMIKPAAVVLIPSNSMGLEMRVYSQHN